MVRSMTGYARQEAPHPWGTLIWEIRSVNHRYLEPHFRLPEAWRQLEIPLRNSIRKFIHRGKIEIAMQLQMQAKDETAIPMNMSLVRRIGLAAKQISQTIDNVGTINPLEILSWPGVVEAEGIDSDAIQHAAITSFEQCLQQLIEHRTREGKELAQLIEQRLVTITEEVIKVRAVLPTILQSLKEKLHARLSEIKEELNQERLEQEMIFYAQKIDVDEELDRLEAHVAEVRRTLQQPGTIGRRLDFLMQELNREANTLSSKSVTTDTTQSAVELKILIEQMREQIQNIE